MKPFCLRKMTWVIIGMFGILAAILINGCAESQQVAAKSGAQLWAENCQRCHNTPSPSDFSSSQWKTIGMHMQTRALLTNEERDKIIGFLQQK